VRLLCLFMVADRVDCPGGWRTNHPLVWFLEEVKRRKLLSTELLLDDGLAVPSGPAEMMEVSAGVVLIQRFGAESRALVIRVRKEGFEVPKGHIEPQEKMIEAALRELREETGLASSVVTGAEAGIVEYSFEQDGVSVTKSVHYFAAFVPTGEVIRFGKLPSRTRELRWVTSNELDVLPLVNEQLRSIIARALEMAAEC
jgi:8-oxo-dGTP pyrophosphatase MutT (NUDIX family)